MSALALLLAALFVDSRTFLFTYALVAAPMSRLITLNAVISSASHVPLGDRFAELARGTLHLSLSKRPLHNRITVLARYALAREILRCAQDDTKKVTFRMCHSERKLL